MKCLKFFVIFFIYVVGCQPSENSDKLEKWKSEIVEVEKAFNDMAQSKGLAKAFEFYAAEDGVIMRNNRIIKGKNAIAELYPQEVRPNETLTWEPTYIDVSKSGDMAFTYGDFIFTFLDSTGIKRENKGIFHTVWKRQNDGTWKFVWD